MRLCSYCGGPILGDAVLVGDDDAASGAHPPVYWHADRAACGPRQPLLPGPDDGVLIPPRFVRPRRQAGS